MPKMSILQENGLWNFCPEVLSGMNDIYDNA